MEFRGIKSLSSYQKQYNSKKFETVHCRRANVKIKEKQVTPFVVYTRACSNDSTSSKKGYSVLSNTSASIANTSSCTQLVLNASKKVLDSRESSSLLKRNLMYVL